MAKITFLADDLTVEVDEGSKLVDVARDSGSSIPFGCTNGVCGTCIVQVKSGKENLNPCTGREAQTLEMFGAEDHRLACQCIIQGDISVDNP